MTTLYCAICGNRFEPDDDHMWIEAEKMSDRERVIFPRTDEYAFHIDCWDRLTAGWMDPA